MPHQTIRRCLALTSLSAALAAAPGAGGPAPDLPLHLSAWGRPGALEPLSAAAPLQADGRLEYRHGSLTEWYARGAGGVEQGFDVTCRPAGEGPLLLALALDVALTVEVLPGARDARFVRVDSGATAFDYHGLQAWDATGLALDCAIVATPGGCALQVDDGTALYPLTIDPWIFPIEANLVPSTVMPSDNFGFGLAVQGDRAVAAATRSFPATFPGSAWVFERQGSAWIETAELQGSDALAGEIFGTDVALDEDRIVVGADRHRVGGPTGMRVGAVYVFDRGPGGWQETAKLLADDGQDGDSFGRSVAVEGDRIAVGASQDDIEAKINAGSVYVFERAQGVWTQVQKLLPSPSLGNQWFGESVALEGNTLAVGAYQHGTGSQPSEGAVFVFTLGGGVWSQEDWFQSSSPEPYALFGSRIDLCGDRIVASAWRDSVVNGSLKEEGAAYVFTRSGNLWAQEAELRSPLPITKGRFGFGVTIDGDWILVGAISEGPAGLVHAFQRVAGDWLFAATLSPQTAQTFDNYGNNVSLDGSTALIGIEGDDTGAGQDTGSLDVVRILPGPALSYCTPGTSASGCQAIISATGTASATSGAGFEVSAQGVEGARDGMFFYGTNGPQALPWGNGTSYQCVAPPVRRGGTQPGSGTAGTCDGAFLQDLNAHWAGSHYLNPGPGATVQIQLWYRDPQSTSNQTTSFSDALEASVEL